MPETTKTSTVQSVERAFRLLEVLNRQAVSSVDQLHRATGLAKPTIVRMLKTLNSAGYVTNDRRQGGYQVTAQVRSLSCGFHGDPLVVEAGRAWAVALTRRLKWPVAIGVLDRDAVIIRFSTIPDSPISPFYATINMRLSLATRALGRAYLAFCPEEERQLLLSMLTSSTGPDAALLPDKEQLEFILDKIRQRGFAERDPAAEPKTSSTLAAPIMDGDRVLATLGLTFFTSAVPRQSALADYVPLLHEAAQAISAQVISMTGPTGAAAAPGDPG